MEARSYAMKGAEILDQALFCPSLEAVGEKLSLLIGTTARFKGKNPRLLSCRNLAREALHRLGAADVGIVFGSEDNGLRREELRLCQWLVEIPTGSGYPVINLAQSAAIVAYELNLAFTDSAPATVSNFASPQELGILLQHTRRTIERLQLSVRMSVERLMKRMQKIVFQAQLEREDVNMLHGLLKEVERKGLPS
jgi:TrmH family RNA methyltransferase